jgi:hypothetical protein
MLKEFFQVLSEHFTKREMVAPTKLDFRTHPREILFWDPEKKSVVPLTVAPPDNRHTLFSLDDIVAYVQHLSDTGKVIWVSDEKISIECEESFHRDILSMDLIPAPLFHKVKKLASSPSMLQEDAIRFVRQDLQGFPGGTKVLTAVRSLRMTKVDDMESSQSHVSNRLSKSIQQDAAGAGDLPEYLDITIPVYTGITKRTYPIRIWISIDFKKPGCILFEPDTTAIEEAIIAERAGIAAQLREALTETNCFVFEGSYRVSS